MKFKCKETGDKDPEEPMKLSIKDIQEEIDAWWERQPERGLLFSWHIPPPKSLKERFEEMEKEIKELKAWKKKMEDKTRDEILKDNPCKSRGRILHVDHYLHYAGNYDHYDGMIMCNFGPNGGRKLSINTCVGCEYREEPEPAPKTEQESENGEEGM